MPLPLIAWGVAAAGAAVVGYAAHRSGKKKGHSEGYSKGYNRAKEEAEAQINELMRQLDELQYQREYVKDQFRDVIQDISTVDTKDSNFFAKIAAFLRGYNNFHLYVVGVISAAKLKCMEIDLPDQLAEELKGIVFGVLEGGFPEKLKKDVDTVWFSNDVRAVEGRMVYCQKKMPDHLILPFKKSLGQIEESVAGLYELYLQEKKLKNKVAELRRAL
jgi:hypothetical protein